MASIIRNWRLYLFFGAVLLGVVGVGSATLLWERNKALREDLTHERATVAAISAAREKDAVAAEETLRAVKEQHLLLQERLRSLSRITDAQDRAYLATPVPNSVRKLLNP